MGKLDFDLVISIIRLTTTLIDELRKYFVQAGDAYTDEQRKQIMRELNAAHDKIQSIREL
jgi:flagellin-like hook-associated protein FlgL